MQRTVVLAGQQTEAVARGSDNKHPMHELPGFSVGTILLLAFQASKNGTIEA